MNFNARKPRDERGWNEDWQVGDIAECVLDDWLDLQEFNPKKGDILTVSSLYEGPTLNTGVSARRQTFAAPPDQA